MSNSVEIRVPVEGGFLVAIRNPDPDYPGISVVFETHNGCQVDIVYIESKASSAYKETFVYCYEDVAEEDFTHMFTIEHQEITDIFAEEE